MARRRLKSFPFPVPGTEVTERPPAEPYHFYPQRDIPYVAPSAAIRDYLRYKRARDFWENEGLESPRSSKYLDYKGKYAGTRDIRRYKEAAVRRAGEVGDPATHSRFWAPEENIDDIFRRQKGKKRKPTRKRRKTAKKKLSGGKNRRKR